MMANLTPAGQQAADDALADYLEQILLDGMPPHPAEAAAHIRDHLGYTNDRIWADTILEQRDMGIAACERVRALHQPTLGGHACRHCSHERDRWVPYPCPTIQALQGNQS